MTYAHSLQGVFIRAVPDVLHCAVSRRESPRIAENRREEEVVAGS